MLREKHRNLLGPHAGIGGERVHEADGTGALSDEVIVKLALAEGQQHRRTLCMSGENRGSPAVP